MTFVYWGGCSSHKKHLLRCLSLNNKKYVQADDYHIRLFEHTCHWTGYVNRQDEINRINPCWDITERRTTHYYDESNVLRQTFKEKRELDLVYTGVFHIMYNFEYDENYAPVVSYQFPPGGITGGADTKIYRPLRIRHNGDQDDCHVDISKEYAKRFKKNPPSDMLHYEAVSQYPPLKGKKKMTINEIPDCHLIIPNRRAAKGYRGYDFSDDSFFEQDWNRYRNIVPVRTDMLDFARNTLVVHGCSSPHEENTVFQTYKEDKNKLFDQIDYYVLSSQNMIKAVRKHNISHTYFDMDKDSWKKTFEIEKEFNRIAFLPVTYELKNCVNKKAARANFQKITEIAKEWLHSRNYPKNNIPENL